MNKLSKLFRRISVVLVFLFFVINGVTIGMFNSAGYINNALGTPTAKYEKIEGEEKEPPIYYESEFSKDINNFTQDELNAKNKAAEEFIETEEEEGAVLLTNKNNALPLKSTDKVTLFGYTTVNPYYRSHSGGGGTQRKVSLLEALDSRNVNYNKTLISAYNGLSGITRNNVTIGEAPVSVYTDAVKGSFTSYGDAAIVILSREAGEGDDLTTNYADSDGTTHGILALNKDEKDMLSLVKSYKDNGTFKRVIVILNTCNTMEAGWLDEYGVDACLWIGGPGASTGFYGVADLLTGASNPSGKIVDTYSTSSLSAPAMENYIRYKGGLPTNVLVYAEDIYVGYKYYETRYEDCVLNRGNAKSKAGVKASKGDWSYPEEVTFPFGSGISYTTFEQVLDKVTVDGGTLTATVTVKNTGEVAGKSVVEVYAQTPYGRYEKDNLVEKSAVQLAAFTKTDVIEPTKTATVEIPVDKYFLASYDYKKLGGYYLSEGDYYLAIGENAHDALNNILAKKGAIGMVDENGNSVTGNATKVYTWKEKQNTTSYSVANGVKVQNQLQAADINTWHKDDGVTYLSRRDWTGTYPKPLTITITDEMWASLRNSEYSKPGDAISSNDIATDTDAALMLADMWGVKLDAVDDEGKNIWDKFISQLSIDELISLMTDQNHIDAINKIAFLGGGNSDGIDGVNVNCYIGENVAAASWNKAMLQRRGEFIGEDCLYGGQNGKVQFLWGPGANYHRTPYAGRNFEYYSEDSVMSYEMAGAQVNGSESKGVIVGIKHFFTNDQETDRGSYKTFTTEQTFREIYLRPFEGAFVKGGATGVMTTNSEVGMQSVGQYKELTTNILRKEWGFDGIVITDAGGGYTTEASFLNGGGNMFCFCGNAAKVRSNLRRAIINGDDGNLLKLLQDSAKTTLYSYAHTNLMNGLTSNLRVVKVTPWWQTLMITVNIILGVLMLAGVALTIVFNFIGKDKLSVSSASAANSAEESAENSASDGQNADTENSEIKEKEENENGKE